MKNQSYLCIATRLRVLNQSPIFLIAILGLSLFSLTARSASVQEAWAKRCTSVLTNAPDNATSVVCDSAGNVIVTGSTDSRLTGLDMLTLKYSGSDGSVLWSRRYDGPTGAHDEARAVAVDSSGNVAVTGYSRNAANKDFYTAKYAAASGGLLWEKRYDGPAHGDDEAYAVAMDSSGNVVVTGYSRNAANKDFYTAKYAAADGALVWEVRYNGLANGDDEAGSVAVDAAGNVLVTGYSRNAGDKDCYTAKYAAANGALVWEKRYNQANQDDLGVAVAVDPSDNAVVTGTSAGHYYTAKYAALDGTPVWEKLSSSPGNFGDQARALAVDASGNVVVTGNSRNASFNLEYYTLEYRANDGLVLWEKRYNGPANRDDDPRAIVFDGTGNPVVTGNSGTANGADIYTVKYDAANNGTVLWEKRSSGPVGFDQAAAVALDSSGNVVVTGSSQNANNNADYYTVKYAANDGTFGWDQRYDGPANVPDRGIAAAVEANGNVAVTGFGLGFYTAKYAAANGSLIWEKRYSGPAPSSDAPSAIAVDASGNVIVTGSFYVNSTQTNLDGYTAKYAAADGALLWERFFSSPANLKESLGALALDSSGNVLVAGFSYANPTNSDFYTAKYAAANGALLWEKRYDGPASRNDSAVAVAVDSNGDVIATGSSANPTNSDIYTAKYAASDGTLLWEKRYHGPGNSQAIALAIDANRDVVVTGSSHNGTNQDFYTAKYAAADGALLWERRYNGPANQDDYPNGIAVDAGRNVLVTGFSRGATSRGDIYTAKYAAATGAVLWQTNYNGPANNEDAGMAVAVDAFGDVVVAGYSADTNGQADFYTTKYASANGTRLWEIRYNGPANKWDAPAPFRCLAIGPSGETVVTGYSESDPVSGVGGTTDCVTVKYTDIVPHPPAVVIPLPDQAATNGAVWSYTFPAGSFQDPDGDTLSYLATGLPPGMSFDGSTRTFSGASTSCAGPFAVTVTATDTSIPPLSVSDTFFLTNLDQTLPIIAPCPTDINTVCAPTLCAASVTFLTPTATDNCGAVTVACVPVSGSLFPKGTNLVTCTATDAAGNTNACVFRIKVVDTTPPVITCSTNIIALCPDINGAQVFYSVTATDNCDGAVSPLCAPLSGSYFPVGTNTVNCSATDLAGNSTACSFTVTVGMPLSITHSGGTTILCWPTNCTGYVLEETPDLKNTNTWDIVPDAVNLYSNRYVVSITGGGGKHYYRLRLQ